MTQRRSWPRWRSAWVSRRPGTVTQRSRTCRGCSTTLLLPGIAAVAAFSYAQAPPVSAPPAVLTVTTSNIPNSGTQVVRILSATIPPRGCQHMAHAPVAAVRLRYRGSRRDRVRHASAHRGQSGSRHRGADGRSHSRRQSWACTYEACNLLRRPAGDAVSRGSPALTEERTLDRHRAWSASTRSFASKPSVNQPCIGVS